MRVKKRADLDLDGLEEDQAHPQGVRETADDDTSSGADWEGGHGL